MIPALANHLWQSTCFAIAVGVFCYWLRRDGAHIRYWLWWIASIKFLVPFSLLTAVGARLAGAAPVGLVPETWTVTAVLVANPFAGEPGSWSPSAVLLGLWAAGSVVLLVRLAAAGLRLQTIVAQARPDRSLDLDGRSIRVYTTAAAVEPGIVGIFRPVLLLPHGIERLLSPAQLDAVLSHEIGHVRRRDNLMAALHMLVEVVFWFHPLVWWIGARLVDERERACDELVVASGHDRTTYAESILDVCEHYAVTPLRCAAGISGSDLKRRITQIMRYQGMNDLKSSKKWLLSISAFAVLGVPIFSGLALQEAAIAQDSEEAFLNPAITDGTAPLADDEYLPIVKVAPIYPPRAAARGLEGYVVLEYTVATDGSTDNVAVVESSSTLFENSAIESALKYKYKPRVVNGTPVAVDGVRIKIVYALEHDDILLNPDAATAESGQTDDAEEIIVRP